MSGMYLQITFYDRFKIVHCLYNVVFCEYIYIQILFLFSNASKFYESWARKFMNLSILNCQKCIIFYFEYLYIKNHKNFN